MLEIVVWSFTEEKDLIKLFEELQTSDGFGKISTFLGNNMLIVIAIAERFRD